MHRVVRVAGLFDQWQKLQILAADLFQVSIDLRGMPYINVVDDGQQVNVNLRLAEPMKGLDDLLMRRLLALRYPIVVVQLFRSVEAQADVKILLGEELAPLVVDGRAV